MQMHCKTARSLLIRAMLIGCVSSAGFAATSANAGCGDRPGTPTDVKAVGGFEQITVTWRSAASETVFWDVEMTDYTGKVLPTQPGIGRGDTGVGVPVENAYSVTPGAYRCFRVKARTERGTEGCISEQWSNKACVNALGGWAAIANSSTGYWGYAHSRMDEATARADAVKGCGNQAASCTFVHSGQAPCLAYAEGRAAGFYFGIGFHQSSQLATQVAMNGCSGGDSKRGCRIVGSFCQAGFQ
jgi:Domain of unknown function (DUF4189)